MGKGGIASKREEPVEVYIRGKAIDVTSFLRDHPGGSKVLKIFKNRDATEQFAMYHSPAAVKRMEAMARRSPDAPTDSNIHTTPAARDFARLTQQLHDLGYFQSHAVDEALKMAVTLSPAVLGMYLLRSGSPCLGATLLAFSFYLAGWTAHDYLHHSVFKGSQTWLVSWNNRVGFALAFFQGLGTREQPGARKPGAHACWA